MSGQKRKELSDKNNIPGEPKPSSSSGTVPNLKHGDLLKTVSNKQLQALLGKGKYPSSLDFSPGHFALENDSFLSACRDVVRDLCLSKNPLLKEIVSLDHLSKLRVLVVDNCQLQTVSLNKLESLESLSLRDNQLTSVPRLRDLNKLAYLDLSGNPLSVGFDELEGCKSLQVLDLARTGLDVNIQQFYQFVLTPLKKLGRLSHVSFAENPVEVSIIKFRLLVISEISRIKYVDWASVTRDEKSEAGKVEHLWADKTLPATALKVPVLASMRMGAGRAQSTQQKRQGSELDAGDKLLGPNDKALVNLLLGSDEQQPPMSKDSALDDFLHETTADPLNDIMNYLLPEAESAVAAPGGGDYEDELMRIIYGDNPPPENEQQKGVAEVMDDDIFTTITADLDAALGVAPTTTKAAKPSLPKNAQLPLEKSVADVDLDDLLDSIIAVEEKKSVGATASTSPAAAASASPSRSAIDILLEQEEGAKHRRLEEEQARVAEERARLEKERQELEREKNRELEREKARLRVEMEAQKQRELDDERRALIVQEKTGKSTQALEDEAMAMLALMEEDVTSTALPSQSENYVPGSGSAMDDADALLASIDALVGDISPNIGGGGATPASPSPKTFGPRSTAAKPKPQLSKAPVVTGALPISRRRVVDDDDDDDLNALLAEAAPAEEKRAVKQAWLAYWSQLNFGDRLGLGTFGVTHVGWCRSMEVSVKKLKLQRFSDDFLRRFQEEVPLLSSLSHPNLARFLGIVADDTLCTMHSYVRGCNLWGYLRNQGNQVDLAFIAGISRGVAAAIGYLHGKKVFHRNLHSKNVLLDGNMVPKLRDYGMQFIKNETYQLANGPINYEAPELLARQPHTETVDAYAYGVLMWELFCREDPYKGLQPLAVKDLVVTQALRPDVTPDIPVVFRRLMGACWNADPLRRPTFVVINKILSKSVAELGSYGTDQAEGATGATTFNGPKPQGSAKSGTAGGDLVAQLDAPSASDSMDALMAKIVGLLSSRDRLTQQRGLRVVYNLCEKKEYQQQMHLMKSLVAILIERAKVSNEKSTRDLSLQALAKMCTDSVCAEEFIDCLGWTMLTEALDSMDVTLELSSSLLMVVLLKNSRNKDAFVSVKGVPVLVRLLLSETENVKTNAVWAASLALENEQTQRYFVEEGGVSVLLRLAQSQNPGVVLRVLVSVGLLLTNPEVFNELKDSGVIQRFLRLLSSPVPLLQKHGIEAIGRFCQVAELREVLQANNGIQSILELLNSTGDPRVKQTAVSALSAYLDDGHEEDGGRDAGYIEQSQALRFIVRLMVAQDAELRLEALRMISKAASIAMLRPQLQSVGALSPLVQLLNAKDQSIRMAALYTLCVATADESLASAVALADGGAQLVRLCDLYPDDDTLELSAETFANIARAPSGISMLRDCGAFPFMVKLLQHENLVVVEGVANALVHASSQPEGRLTLLALDAVRPLLELTQTQDESLREAVLWSTPNWCSDATTAQVVADVAMGPVAAGLLDAKENVQSICVKTVLLMAASGDYKAQMKQAGVAQALNSLAASTANATLKMAATKALSML